MEHLRRELKSKDALDFKLIRKSEIGILNRELGVVQYFINFI